MSPVLLCFFRAICHLSFFRVRTRFPRIRMPLSAGARARPWSPFYRPEFGCIMPAFWPPRLLVMCAITLDLVLAHSPCIRQATARIAFLMLLCLSLPCICCRSRAFDPSNLSSESRETTPFSSRSHAYTFSKARAPPFRPN